MVGGKEGPGLARRWLARGKREEITLRAGPGGAVYQAEVLLGRVGPRWNDHPSQSSSDAPAACPTTTAAATANAMI